jgi:hypothetical protein
MGGEKAGREVGGEMGGGVRDGRGGEMRGGVRDDGRVQTCNYLRRRARFALRHVILSNKSAYSPNCTFVGDDVVCGVVFLVVEAVLLPVY